MTRILSLRELNRSTLDRQLLLERKPFSLLDALRQTVGLQSQALDPPYIGLWNRLSGFKTGDLEQALLDRQAVRIQLMRTTIHLVTADDAWPLRLLVQASIEQRLSGSRGRQLAGIDRDSVERRIHDVLGNGTLRVGDIGRAVVAGQSDVDAIAMGNAIRAWVPMVQTPPRGNWRSAGAAAAYSTLADWIGPPPLDPPGLDWLIRRYLAAFGPATIKDLQSWSGLTRLATAVKSMDDLVVYRDESGREMYDLADASIPEAETPAPVRFLGEWDTAILGYQDKSRLVENELFTHIYTINGIYKAVILVDGFVAGLWRSNRSEDVATLTIELVRPLTKDQKEEIEQEGKLLLGFLEPVARPVVEITSI